MPGDEIADALREFRKAIRYTQEEIAEAIKVPVGRWKNWEYGRSNPPAKVLSDLQRLGFGSSTPPPVLNKPLIPVGFATAQLRYAGSVPAGEWGDPLASEDFVEVEAKYEHHRRFAATVAGDSCYPALRQGDLAIWHSDTTPPYGSIVIAQRVADSCCTVKQLLYEETGPILHAVNPKYDDVANVTDWTVIARLVGVIRKSEGAEQSWYSPEGLKVKHLV